MITKRDQDIFNFIQDFHIATSGQIIRLFFDNYRYGMMRLKKLTEEGFLQTTRSTINSQMAYYIKKPALLQQTHHDLIRVELYTHMKQFYNMLEWNNEKTIENIRPDALCYIKHNNIIYPVIVEIHLNNKFDFNKYKGLNWYALFGNPLPRVVICTDRQVTISQKIGIKFLVVNIDMKHMENVLK